MDDNISRNIGILGGGQLGKMLIQAGSTLGLNIHILENSIDCPAYKWCQNFTIGDITDYDSVVNWGKNVDIVTIEIENVNIEALEALEQMNIQVFPKPSSLKIIKDKGIQKMFYESKNISTSEFSIYNNASSIIQAFQKGKIAIPFVQKSRKDGYDGKGVHIVKTETDLNNLLDTNSIIEDKVDIAKEIAIIVCRNNKGDVVTFPSVEMEFHPTANLVEYLFSPSSMSIEQEKEASNLAIQIAIELDIIGLLAVELFIDTNGKILVNEIAPRPHNSGHHTIEACDHSQYDLHLRAILGLPLPIPKLIRPAVMVNLLGEEGFIGNTHYQGLSSCLSINGVYPHLYGKKETKPFRKMGHVTIVSDHLDQAKSNAHLVKQTLKVISQ